MKNRPEMTEEDLILHFYGESTDPRAVDAALAADPDLRRRFDELARELAAVATVEAPAPPDDLAQRVWQELRPRLSRPRFRAVAAPRFWGTSWFGESSGWGPRLTAAAAALALVAALVLGYVAGRRGSPVPAATMARSADGAATGLSTGARERLLLASVESHLAGSERLLTRVANAAPTDAAALAEESAWATALVSSNRLYRRAAERSGQRRIVALLDELEPLLLELAHSTDAAPEDLQATQRRIDHTDLLFKLRVTGERLQRDAGASRATPRTVS